MERKPGFLDYDGPVMRISREILRLILLNMLFLLTSLPAVTLGAAMLARSSVFLQRCREGDWQGHIVSRYFRAFRSCLKQGIVLSLLLLLGAGVLYLDFSWLMADAGMAPGILLGMLAVVTLVLMMLLEYLIAVLSTGRFSMGLGVKAAVRLLILNWWRALLVAAGKGGILLLFLSLPKAFIAALPAILLLGFSLTAYLTAALLGPTME